MEIRLFGGGEGSLNFELGNPEGRGDSSSLGNSGGRGGGGVEKTVPSVGPGGGGIFLE